MKFGFLTFKFIFCTFISLFYFSSFVLAQSIPSVDIVSRFPYKIDFNSAEISFLKKLDETTLLQLILIAKNLLAARQSVNVSVNPFLPTSPSAISSNSSNSPSQNSASNFSPNFTPNSPSNSSPPNSSNPFLPQQSQNQQNSFSQVSDVLKGVNNGLEINFADFDKSLDVKDIDPICQPNYGVDLGGSCPDMKNTTSKLKETTMKACTVIKKRLKSVSAYRTPDCNNKVSKTGYTGPHTKGAAIDLLQEGLSSEEKVKVYRVFKTNGFNGFGCYGQQGHVHFDHLAPRHWGSGCPPELRLAGYFY